jgi:hypothetical protein
MTEELKQILLDAGKTEVKTAEVYLLQQLKLLQQSGDLSLGPDKDLTGMSLELRVLQLFNQINLNISEGRPGQEDFVVIPEPDDENKDNIVIEVKSARSPNPKIDDLRQLDDWVFDLSGEEEARKHGLGGGLDTTAMVTRGLMSSKKRHPTPHKGVLIFNGPVGTPFEERVSPILNPNQIDFVEKRNFCVVGLNNLITLIALGPDAVMSALRTTVGEYSDA